MWHKRIKNLLLLYVDDGLTGKQKQMIEEHLSSCSECQQYFQELTQSLSHLKSLKTSVPLPSGFDDRLRERLISVQDRKGKIQGRLARKIREKVQELIFLPLPKPALSVTVLLVVFMVGVGFYVFWEGVHKNTQLAIKTEKKIEKLVGTLKQKKRVVAIEKTYPETPKKEVQIVKKIKPRKKIRESLQVKPPQIKEEEKEKIRVVSSPDYDLQIPKEKERYLVQELPTKEVLVKVYFIPPEDINGFSWEVYLPEGVFLIDKEDKSSPNRHFSWQDNLKKGEPVNLLIPVRVVGEIKAGKFILKAVASARDVKRETEIDLASFI